MILIKPAYFDSFRCIAGSCPDSCCKEWGVQVDAASAAYYRTLPGELGDRLRQVLAEEDGETVMSIEDGRCPMWRDDGLCRIQAELGEDALCKTCREFPRLTHDYGDFLELTLELSCPEAARLILTAEASPTIATEVPGGQAPDYDPEAMEILKATREIALEIVSDNRFSVTDTLALTLMYGYQAQGELDGGEAIDFHPHAALSEARDFARDGTPAAIRDFFLELEILTDAWKQRLLSPTPGAWQEEYRNLLRYFIERYWLQAVSDYDLAGRVKFSLVACLLIRYLGGSFPETAQLFSKEIENDADNLDAILDAAYSHPAFTDEKLLGMLLN